jgi:cell wall-associated NlpC family hydrolase
MTHELAGYIGSPWVAGAQGPDAWDCMSLVRDIQGRYFGVNLPAISVPDYDDQHAIAELMDGHVELSNWVWVVAPKHGDVVFIKRPRRHYGVWLNIDGGGVLHCISGQGVIFSKDSAWVTSGFGRKLYLRHRSRM